MELVEIGRETRRKREKTQGSRVWKDNLQRFFGVPHLEVRLFIKNRIGRQGLDVALLEFTDQTESAAATG